MRRRPSSCSFWNRWNTWRWVMATGAFWNISDRAGFASHFPVAAARNKFTLWPSNSSVQECQNWYFLSHWVYIIFELLDLNLSVEKLVFPVGMAMFCLPGLWKEFIGWSTLYWNRKTHCKIPGYYCSYCHWWEFLTSLFNITGFRSIIWILQKWKFRKALPKERLKEKL